MSFITKPQAVSRVLLHKLYEVPIELTSPQLIGCSEHLYHLQSVRTQHQMPSHDGVCPSNREHCVTDFSEYKAALYIHEMSNTVMHAC